MRFGNWRYKNKIAFMVFLFAFFSMSLLGYFFLRQSYNEWRDGELTEEYKNLAAYSQSLNQFFDACELKADFLRTSRELHFFMHLQSPVLTQELNFVQYYEDLINTLRAGVPQLSIQIVTFYGNRNLGGGYKTWDSFQQNSGEDEHGLMEKIRDAEDTLWVIREARGPSGIETHLCLYLDITAVEGKLGVIEIKIPVSYLSALYENELVAGSSIAIIAVDHSQVIVISSLGADIDHAGEQQSIQKYGFVLEEEIYNFPGRVRLVIPREFVTKRLQTRLLIYTGGILVIAVGIIIMIVLVVGSMTKQLTLMISRINESIINLSENEDYKDYRDMDFRNIGQQIYGLIRLVKTRYAKIQEYETEKVQLELELLQARFDPHFLYNTLGTIKYLNPDPVIKQSIEAMISYYRIVLSKGSVIITIADEVRLIEKYVELQRFTYALNIEFHLDVNAEILRCSIIKHILQPIVENALMHGLKIIDKDGTLTLRGYKREQDIFFEIIDNGVGMNESQIEKLLSQPKSIEDGYGLYNVQKRIQVYYGSQYGLHIESQNAKGTKVTMKIPATEDIVVQ